jgi:hypothetical protein
MSDQEIPQGYDDVLFERSATRPVARFPSTTNLSLVSPMTDRTERMVLAAYAGIVKFLESKGLISGQEDKRRAFDYLDQAFEVHGLDVKPIELREVRKL